MKRHVVVTMMIALLLAMAQPSAAQQPLVVTRMRGGDVKSYGTLRVSQASNTPFTCVQHAMAQSPVDHAFYIFCGRDAVGTFNDVWKFNVTSNQWTWMTGATTTNVAPVFVTAEGVPSTGNSPGSRAFAATWMDVNGMLYLFGGNGRGSVGVGLSDMNDMWTFNTVTYEWTWVGGNSTTAPSPYGVYPTKGATGGWPGARSFAMMAYDGDHTAYLFGGQGRGAVGFPVSSTRVLNDMWSFDMNQIQWTFLGGTSTPGNATDDRNGIYGTQGVESANNWPGGRALSQMVYSSTTNRLYMFGGKCYTNTTLLGTFVTNDMWSYSIATGRWTWLTGYKTNSGFEYGIYGPYGVPGLYGVAGSVVGPGARYEHTMALDAKGDLYLHGGLGCTDSKCALGFLNDVWRFSTTSKSWTFLHGNTTSADTGSFGTLTVPAASNRLRARAQCSGVFDTATNNMWIHAGLSAAFTTNDDLWMLDVANYPYTCAAGYTGSSCQTEINECVSSPCLNGGTCVDAVNAFVCQCAPGWSGPSCGIDIDECASTPCQNGGTCTDLLNSFHCDCTPSWTYTRCELDVLDTCASNPCQHSGTCTDGVSSYNCSCALGYSGDQCQTDINECASNPCPPGVPCHDLIANYTCACDPGVIGDNCQTNIDDCASAPCQNGASCIDGFNSYTCVCPAGYSGVRCETDVDECASNPCANGATCTDHVNSFSCTCVPGYSGARCISEIAECASNPCLSGSICAEALNRYTCVCPPGFTGTHCQTNINECASNPCQYGGTCNDGIASFNCSCPPGTIGAYCSSWCGATEIRFPTSNDSIQAVPPSFVFVNVGIAGDAFSQCLWARPQQNGTDLIPMIQTTAFTDPQARTTLGFMNLKLHFDFDIYGQNSVDSAVSFLDSDLGSWHYYCITHYDGVATTLYRDAVKVGETLNVYPINLIGFPKAMIVGGSAFTADEVRIYYGQLTAANILSLFQLQTTVSPNVENMKVLHLNFSEQSGNVSRDSGPFNSTAFTFVGSPVWTSCISCANMNCLNGATCTDHFDTSFCACAPGFAGTRCQTDVNECASQPCLNGASCVDLTDAYSCTCGAGFSGTLCELDVHQRIILTETVPATAYCGGFLNVGANATALSTGSPLPNRTVTWSFVHSGDNATVTQSATTNSSGRASSASPLSAALGTWTVTASTPLAPGESDRNGLYNTSFELTQPKTITILSSGVTFQLSSYPDPIGYEEFVTITARAFRADGSPVSGIGVGVEIISANLDDDQFFSLTIGPDGIGNATSNSQMLSSGGDYSTAITFGGVPPCLAATTYAPSGYFPTFAPIYFGTLSFTPVSNIVLNATTLVATCAPASVHLLFIRRFDGSVFTGQMFIVVASTINGGSSRTLCSTNANPAVYNCTFTPTAAGVGSITASTSGGGFGQTTTTLSYVVLANAPALLATPNAIRSISGGITASTNVTSGGLPIASANVTFSIVYPDNSTHTFNTTTNSTGMAAISSSVISAPGQYLIVAQYAGTPCTPSGVSAPSVVYVCASGFSGIQCQTNIDECASAPCANGGTCVDDINQFACLCPLGYSGLVCSTDVNECASAPCVNGGTCADGVGSYQCACPSGFSGMRCETDVDECGSTPCLNSATCTDAVNSYTCQCPSGFSGLQCQTDINECVSAPCAGGGTCVDRIGFYTCNCASGYSGSNCETDVNECGSLPCQNGGTCTDLIASFACVCTAGFSGASCQTNVNECASSPCQNGGSCGDGTNQFACTCAPGYSGFLCMTDVNECDSAPCLNAGTCNDGVASYTCLCAAGFSGLQCQTNVNECGSNPCRNNGTCVDGVASYACTCLPGYSGTNCETDVNECVSSPCANGGTCADGVGSWACTCAAGYSGLNCETDVNECASTPCANGGTCGDGINQFACVCVAGYSGLLCSTDVNECASSPCANGATCNDSVNGWTCACPAGYSGLRCETDINECASAPCLAPTPTVFSFTSSTAPCYTVNGNPCNPDLVMIAGAVNHIVVNVPMIHPLQIQDVYGFGQHVYIGASPSTAVVSGDIYVTIPATGYPTQLWYWCAYHRSKFGNITVIAPRVCTDSVNGYGCQCTPGTTGAQCQTQINQCASLPCQNGGTCGPTVDAYICACSTGWSGVNCQLPSNTTSACSSTPCQNLGECASNTTDDTFTCACTAGYSGLACQTNINECASNPCVNGGTCADQKNAFGCACVAGYSGVRCETAINSCASVPCGNGGTCTDYLNGYECTCVVGYSGVDCRTDINECESAPCANGGTCADVVNGFDCACSPGYSGLLCSTNIDECASLPCAGSATCVDGVNQFTCSCPLGYSGLVCSTNIDECTSAPCANGGTCADGIGSYSCSCASGYSGLECQTDVDECASGPCDTTATCVDMIGGWTCECAPGYGGSLCGDDINECLSSPCSNGGTCNDLLNGWTCLCPGGFSGTRCDTEIDECSSNPCRNGGTCTDLIAGYNCTCVAPTSGSQCQYLTPCDAHPAPANQTCILVQNAPVYQCPISYVTDLTRGSGLECDAQSFGPGVVAGQNRWTSSGNSTSIIQAHIVFDVVRAYEGYGFLFLSNARVNLHEFGVITNPVFLKTVGAPSITSQLTGGRFYGGGTFNASFVVATVSSVPDGTNVAFQITNDITNATVFQVLFQYHSNNGLLITALNSSVFVTATHYHAVQVVVTAFDGPGNDVATVVVDQSILYDGLADGETNPAQPMNTARFAIYSALDIGFNVTSPLGLRIDAEYLRVLQLGTPNNDYYTGFNPDECFNNVTNPCQGNGTACIPYVQGSICACPAGRYGPRCETDINECSSEPCQNGATCLDGANSFACQCIPGYTGTLCETLIDTCAGNPCNHIPPPCPQSMGTFLLVNMSCVQSPKLCGNISGYATFTQITDSVISIAVVVPVEWQISTIWTATSATSSNLPHVLQTCGSSGSSVCLDVSGYTPHNYPCNTNNTQTLTVSFPSGIKSDRQMTASIQVDVFPASDASCSTSNNTPYYLDAGYDWNGAAASPCVSASSCTPSTAGCPCGPLAYQPMMKGHCTGGPSSGTCTAGVNSFSCDCAAGFSGPTCQTDINECSSRPCQNGGTCTDGVDAYSCTCVSGYTGTDCQISPVGSSSAQSSSALAVFSSSAFLSSTGRMYSSIESSSGVSAAAELVLPQYVLNSWTGDGGIALLMITLIGNSLPLLLVVMYLFETAARHELSQLQQQTHEHSEIPDIQ